MAQQLTFLASENEATEATGRRMLVLPPAAEKLSVRVGMQLYKFIWDPEARGV